MLNDSRSHGLWEKTAPAAPSTSALSEDIAADVVLIGAGYTGLSAALHLAEAGSKVVVLEAAEVGFGGAGRNVGLVNAGLWLQPQEVIDALPEGIGDRLLDLLGDGPRLVFETVGRLGIDCEAVPQGTLHCAVGQAGVTDLATRERQWRARGAPVRLVDTQETRARIGTTHYLASLLDERAGTIQPLAYARGLARAAVAAGVRIFTASPATAVARDGARWRVATPTGSVTAEWVIPAGDLLTSGPYAELATEQVRLPYFNFATEPLGEHARAAILPGREGCWDTREVLSSFRFDAAGRLVFGSVGALRYGGLEVHRAWAKRAIAKIFPEIAGVGFEDEWYGWIGMTDDAIPRFHRFADTVFSISGYNGRGISPGTTFGKLIAERILGRIGDEGIPLPITPPKPAALRLFKQPYYEVGAQAFHLVDAWF